MKYNFPMTLDRQFKNTLENMHDKYGTKMLTIEGLAPEQLDTCRFFHNFMGVKTIADATIDDNANVTNRNINTMTTEAMKPFTKLLSKNKIFIEMKEEFGLKDAQQYLESCVNGEIYEHDSHNTSLKPYCFAFSISEIVNRGLFFLDEMKADSPKHWDTYNHQTLEFISYATSMLSGAVGVVDYLVYAYYFYYTDTKNMSKEESKKYMNQKFQELIFNLNQPYLKDSTQSAYTNLSILDEGHLLKFFANKQYPDGTDILEHINELIIFQKDFLDYIGELRKIKWHTFPVLSASLIFKDGEYEDEETSKYVVHHNWYYGFNDVNIMNVEEVTSAASCCRLVSNIAELDENKIFNSIGGSDLNVGSTKVGTNNLVRLAILSEGDIGKFIQLVRENTQLIHKFHYAHRKILQKLIDRGLLPLYTHGLMKLKDQFATIGITGVFEAVKILGGIETDENGSYYTQKGYIIAEKMFEVIKDENSKTKERYGYMSNVEQIPSESCSIKLNKKDRLYFGNQKINDILGKDCNIYGNQWIPLKEEASIFKRIEASKLDNYCGGGAILHINLGENFNSFDDAWEFTVNLAKQGIKYFSYISLIDICNQDHSFFGDICPICGGKSVEKGIKIVGYLVKERSFKDERKEELKQRKFYKL